MLHERSTTVESDPVLFRTAVARTDGAEVPGAYDASLQVWAINDCGQLRPLIECADDALLETQTVTKVRQEADDQDIGNGDMLGAASHVRDLPELLTKTDVQQEGDDETRIGAAQARAAVRSPATQTNKRNTRSVLLELETKTSADVEHDDQGPVF